jgi:4a-hydroxytetrahydrobiopterin dehydratase
VLEIGLDSADAAAIMPFWRAVLGLRDSPLHDELIDGTGILPTLWFQSTEPHDEPRQRFHLDIRVPPEEAFARVEAALAAGGTLVSDDRAPTFWVLADAQGNKACVTTWTGRD